jgi:hypothetical protein
MPGRGCHRRTAAGLLASALALGAAIPPSAGRAQTVTPQDRLQTQIEAAQALPPTLRRRRLRALHGQALPLASAAPADSNPAPLADPAGILAFDQAVLRRDPTNLQARADAVTAALQMHDIVRAAQLAGDAVETDPNDPGGWMLSARVAQQSRAPRLAMLELARARELRGQQIDADREASDEPLSPPASAETDSPWTPAAGMRTAQAVYANPFRDQPQDSASQPEGAATSTDPMTRQIDATLATLQAQVAPQVAAEMVFDGRSGQNGLSALGSIAVPIEASFSPGGYGKLTFLARPTLLFAGNIGGAPLQQGSFGTQAFGVRQLSPATQGFVAPYAGYQQARGVGLDMDYAYSWFEGDIGNTPLGFRQTNVVGGVVLTPRLASDLILRLTAERRAVTDSLLSYAGTLDPRTGNTMGGVIRNRGYAQLELSDGAGYWYLGAGGDSLRGENVAANSEAEAGAGVSYPVWTSDTDELRLGGSLVYFGYSKNLDYFTLGQGGYFSPQSYVALLLPVSYAEKLGKLSYMVSAAPGVQTYHEDPSSLFPTNAALQAALSGAASGINGLRTRYAGQNSTGAAGSAHGEIQYEITPAFDIGASADFHHAGNYDEGDALIYGRYTFGGAH